MRFIIGFIIAIGLLIFAFVLIFRGHGGSTNVQTTTRMLDYANTSKVVQLTTEGPVNADQTHREIRITVSNTQTTMETFQGYGQSLLSTKSYANNTAAYADFLRALDLAGYRLGNTSKTAADERGYCSSGYRYVMNIKDGDKDIQRFWFSSCGSGTFRGKIEVVKELFRAQVPDYGTVSGNVL